MSRGGECCYWLCCISETASSTRASVNPSQIASVLSALISLVVVAVAVSTGQWLLTEERLPASSRAASQTEHHQNQHNASAEPSLKLTYSGLWRVCVASGSSMEYECSNIDYFPKEEYSPDPSDSTMAIPYAVTKSAVFFLFATALLVIAEVCFFAGQLVRPRPGLLMFSSGVAFIVSGLLMLVGMVMFISVFKAEVGSKLRPRSSFQGPPFTYRYGYSFLLYVSGFITTEFAGTSAIFLHISWQQLELAREISKRKYADNCENQYGLENHRGIIHSAPPINHVYGGFHLCERHQKRYYYEPEPMHCQCHHHHLHHHHHNHHNQLDYDEYLPTPTGIVHDFTTETVSTIADAVDDYALEMHQECVTLDLGENLPPLPETVRNSAWRSSSLKRTTPV